MTYIHLHDDLLTMECRWQCIRAWGSTPFFGLRDLLHVNRQSLLASLMYLKWNARNSKNYICTIPEYMWNVTSTYLVHQDILYLLNLYKHDTTRPPPMGSSGDHQNYMEKNIRPASSTCISKQVTVHMANMNIKHYVKHNKTEKNLMYQRVTDGLNNVAEISKEKKKWLLEYTGISQNEEGKKMNKMRQLNKYKIKNLPLSVDRKTEIKHICKYWKS